MRLPALRDMRSRDERGVTPSSAHMKSISKLAICIADAFACSLEIPNGRSGDEACIGNLKHKRKVRLRGAPSSSFSDIDL